jgi:hypothetical protein
MSCLCGGDSWRCGNSVDEALAWFIGYSMEDARFRPSFRLPELTTGGDGLRDERNHAVVTIIFNRGDDASKRIQRREEI